MSEAHARPYKVKTISVIAKGADVLVREYLLGPGDTIPWHHHTEVTDHYYSLEGRVTLETRAPDARRVLGLGASATVSPPAAHQVSNSTERPCRFLLIQGVGRYDFIKEE